MPRRAKGPRLYLRTRKGRPPTWVILDTGTEVGTGCSEADLAGAEAAFAHYLTSKHNPATSSTRLADILVADVINIYLKEHAPHVANTDFLKYTALPILDWWGDKTLAAIRGVTCRQYVTWRTSQGVKDATARHDLKTLRAAVNFYHREYGPLDAVPAFTMPPKPQPKDRWLSRSEAARMIWKARKTYPNIMRLIFIGIYTGTRSGAIKRLKWVTSLHSGWVDLENGIIYRRGRSETDSKKRQPPCQIPARLLPLLRAWKRKDMADGIGSVIHYNRMPQKAAQKSWRTVRTAAGLGPDVTPHTLRHTCVCWLMRAGVPSWEVAGFVGMTVQMIDEIGRAHV